MAHGKETPRQKMIGMMYLVLTALLALNVSKDILDSFVLVDSGLTQTNQNFQAKNDFIYQEFGKAMATSSESKVRPWRDSALVVKKYADELYSHIAMLKKQIILKADGDSISFKSGLIDGNLINAKDNTDIPAQIMVGDNNDKEGKKLKKMIINYRERLIGMAQNQPGLIESLKKTLITDVTSSKLDVQNTTWESEHFEHMPLIAVNTIMSKLQGDIRNAESEMIRYLFSMIEAGTFKFNKLDATVIPNSSYIIKGNEYKADVFIAAFDTSQIPQIYIGQTEDVKGPDGSIVDIKMVGNYQQLEIDPLTRKGIFRRLGTTTGTNRWSGLIALQSSDGTWIKRKFNAEYVVAEPNVVISPTKMNVFYIGVDNPVAISIPGVPHDKIKAVISNGFLRKEGQGWVAKPADPGNALVSVSAEIDGKTKSMGSMEFRVKNIPDPIAKVAGLKSGKVDKKVLMEQAMVVADLEGFDFAAKFNIIEFTVSAKSKGFEVNATTRSYKISDEQKAIIANANKGDKVVFSEIKAIGPDGKPRELNGIILTIK